MSRINNVFLLIGLGIVCSCDAECPVPNGDISESVKTIQWEVFYQVEPDLVISNFAIAEEVDWLFFTDNLRNINRINISTGKQDVLFSEPTGPSYVHFKNGKLYMFYEKDFTSYCSISSDFGESFQHHPVGVYTNYAAGWYEGAFVNLIVNRLFEMPNGDLVLPHIMTERNNAEYLIDNRLIAVSTDGGATWSQKESENSYISTLQNERLFAIDESWDGVSVSVHYFSDDLGQTWQATENPYVPQATDWENHLIAGGGNELQKFKEGTWQRYSWEENGEPLVSITSLNYGGVRGDDPNGRKMEDFEFDSNNSLYVIGRDRKSICRTNLN